MNSYDDLLREKETEESMDDQLMEKHWEQLEKQLDNPMEQSIVKPKGKIKTWIKKAIAVAAIGIITFFSYRLFKQPNTKQTKDTSTKFASSIQPLKETLNIPYEHFSFDPTIGDTLYTKNGSIIIFPKNAVLDKDGNAVNGKIEVETREFNDAFDYSIAGIPMGYDSAGVKYQFLSSGMIDIKAYQNGALLFVNPKAKPKLHLASTNTEKNTNLYQLDTVTGSWSYRGKDTVTDLAQLNNTRKESIQNKATVNPVTSAKNNLPVPESTNNRPIITQSNSLPEMPKPIKPEKANDKNPIIEILIDPASFKELLVYNNLKFEVLGNNKEEIANASKIEWENIELKKGIIAGTYKAKFSTTRESVEYDVKPVFEAKDFDKALLQYEEKLKEYNNQIQNQLKSSIVQDEVITKDTNSKNNVRIEAIQEVSSTTPQYTNEINRMEELNRLMKIRNLEIAEQNKKIEAENKRILALMEENKRRIAEQNRITDSINKAWELQYRSVQLHDNLLRSFEIDGFGYWNCDQPTNPEMQNFLVNFTDEKKNTITFTKVSFAILGVNKLSTFFTTEIRIITDRKYIAWLFSKDTFYYIKPDAFEQIRWTPNGSVAIAMKAYTGNATTYLDLKREVFGNIFYRQNNIAN